MKKQIYFITIVLLVLSFTPKLGSDDSKDFYKKLNMIIKDKSLKLKIVEEYHGTDLRQSAMLPLAVKENCNCIDSGEVDSFASYTLRTTKDYVSEYKRNIYIEKWSFRSDTLASEIFDRLEEYPPHFCLGQIAAYGYILYGSNIYYLKSYPELTDEGYRIRDILKQSGRVFTKLPKNGFTKLDSLGIQKNPFR